MSEAEIMELCIRNYDFVVSTRAFWSAVAFVLPIPAVVIARRELIRCEPPRDRVMVPAIIVILVLPLIGICLSGELAYYWFNKELIIDNSFVEMLKHVEVMSE